MAVKEIAKKIITFATVIFGVVLLLIQSVIAKDAENSNIYEENFVNDYYYNQLSGKEKEFYDVIAKSRKKFIANEKIYLGTISCKETELKEQVMSTAGNALRCYLCDNPEATLWLDTRVTYSAIPKKMRKVDRDCTIICYEIYIKPLTSSNKYHNFNNSYEINLAMEEIEKVSKEFIETLSGLSDKEKLFKIHEWILDRLIYDDSSPNMQNIYGTIIEKRTVCGGLAWTFKYIADRAGIPTIASIGKINETLEHAWNYVYIDEQWYLIDITMDLQYKNGGLNMFLIPYYLGGQKDKFLRGIVDIYKDEELLYGTYIMVPLEKVEDLYKPYICLNPKQQEETNTP